MIFDGEETLEPIKWLVAGLIPAEGLGMLFGESDVGKTFNALNLGVAVASGQPWHGHPSVEGTVVFVETEGGRAFAVRKHAAKVHACLKEDSKLPFVTVNEPLLFGPKSAEEDPDRPRGLALVVREQVTKRGLPPIRLAVIDTLAQNLAGDESENADMSPFLRQTRTWLKHLSEGATFGLLIHHPGHAEKGRGRGASSLPADLDLILHLTADPNMRDLLTLHCKRMRDAERFSQLTLKLKRVEVSVKGKPILDAFGKPQTSLVVIGGREAVDEAVSQDAVAALREALLGALPHYPDKVAVRSSGGILERLKPILGKTVGHDRVEAELEKLESEGYVEWAEGRTPGSRRWGKVDILAEETHVAEVADMSEPVQPVQSPTAGGSGPHRSGPTPAYLGGEISATSTKSLNTNEIELAGSPDIRASSATSIKSQKVVRLRRKAPRE